MIDGIPNRPLYFYQKDIIDARGYERGYPLVNFFINYGKIHHFEWVIQL